MRKFIITWNCGYGDNADVVEAKDEDAAQDLAYEAWRQDAESNAYYSVKEYTPENLRDHDLEP